MKKRRDVLGVLGVALSGTLAGCFFDANPTRPGTLILDNEHDTSHTVRITINKMSNNSDDVPGQSDRTPTASVTPQWQRTREFEIEANGILEEPNFISETGAFYVECLLDGSESVSTWLGLYPAGPDAQQVAEAHLYVSIRSDGAISVSTPVDD